MKKIFCSLAIALSIVGSLVAQQTETSPRTNKIGNSRPAPLKPFASNDLAVPSARGSWSIFVLTSGGFMGTGKGNFTLISDGNFSSTETFFADTKYSKRSLKPLTALISKLTIPKNSADSQPNFTQSSPVSFCNDCYKTTFIVYRRESDGTVKNFKIDWDDSTKSKINEDILMIYEGFKNLITTKASPNLSNL